MAHYILGIIGLLCLISFGNNLAAQNTKKKTTLRTKSPDTQKKIVWFHNLLRSRVEPTASNMLQLNWYPPAAEDAQRWAEACLWLTHDNVTGRHTDEYGSCGQNIFVANKPVPWMFAIKKWFDERNFFTYNGSIDLMVVGHYTQMVWYSTHKVGCGFHPCRYNNKRWFSYVCNYCPIGNHPDRVNRPYSAGPTCDECPNDCIRNKLCTNWCIGADYWVNCIELNATWHNWLCDDKEGENYLSCRATCDCTGKIH